MKDSVTTGQQGSPIKNRLAVKPEDSKALDSSHLSEFESDTSMMQKRLWGN